MISPTTKSTVIYASLISLVLTGIADIFSNGCGLLALVNRRSHWTEIGTDKSNFVWVRLLFSTKTIESIHLFVVGYSLERRALMLFKLGRYSNPFIATKQLNKLRLIVLGQYTLLYARNYRTTINRLIVPLEYLLAGISILIFPVGNFLERINGVCGAWNWEEKKTSC